MQKTKKTQYLRHWIKSNAFRNQYKGRPDPSDYCDCIIEYWSTDLKLSFSDTVAIAARLTWPLSDMSEFRGCTARSVYNLYWSSNLQELSKRDSTEPLKKGLAYGPHTGPQPDKPSCCSVKPSTSWVWLEEISRGFRWTHGQRIAWPHFLTNWSGKSKKAKFTPTDIYFYNHSTSTDFWNVGITITLDYYAELFPMRMHVCYWHSLCRTPQYFSININSMSHHHIFSARLFSQSRSHRKTFRSWGEDETKQHTGCI